MSLGPWLWFSALGEMLALLSLPSVLLGRRGRPQSAAIWVLILLGAPYLGMLFWWLLGRNYLQRPGRRHSAATSQVAQTLEAQDLARTPTSFEPLLPIVNLPQHAASGVFPPSHGNEVDVLEDAAEAYPALERLITEAKHHVHLLFYIWQTDKTGLRFRDLLVAAARSGVEVRLLYDGVGSALSESFLRPLREAGGQIAVFLPVRLRRRITLNFRNHRKLAVADGIVGFTGGLNIGDEYTHDWHDIGLRLEGPVVEQLQQVFADDWLFATGQDLAHPPYFGQQARNRPIDDRPDAEDRSATCGLVASGPDNRYNLTHDAFLLAINNARHRVWMITPYFIPSLPLMSALRGAVYRGLDVRLILPARSDIPLARLAARSYYPELLGSGVRIFEYQPSVLHAKVLIFDGGLSVLGSANLDTRSFKMNFEVSCFISSALVNHALVALFERDMARCQEVRPADVSPRHVWDRLVESAAHLLSPLL